MTQGTYSNYLVEKWLAELNGKWAALHFDDPLIASSYASEVTGGSYTRKKMTMTAPSSRTTWNSAALTWTALPATLVTHVAFWDAQRNGNLLGAAPLPAIVRVMPGGTYSLPAKNLAISFRS